MFSLYHHSVLESSWMNCVACTNYLCPRLVLFFSVVKRFSLSTKCRINVACIAILWLRVSVKILCLTSINPTTQNSEVVKLRVERITENWAWKKYLDIYLNYCQFMKKSLLQHVFFVLKNLPNKCSVFFANQCLLAFKVTRLEKKIQLT